MECVYENLAGAFGCACVSLFVLIGFFLFFRFSFYLPNFDVNAVGMSLLLVVSFQFPASVLCIATEASPAPKKGARFCSRMKAKLN